MVGGGSCTRGGGGGSVRMLGGSLGGTDRVPDLGKGGGGGGMTLPTRPEVVLDWRVSDPA